LAATLYHLLKYVKPPDALSRAGALVNGQPDPLIPANQVAAVSGAVSAVLNKGMSQKRDDRYASALDMREALRLAAANQPHEVATIVGADSATLANANTILLEQATKVGGSPTTPINSEAQTLLASEATKVRAANSAAETATLVRPSTNGNRTKVWIGAALVLLVLAGGAGGFYLYKKKQAQQNQSAPVTTQAPAQTEPNQSTGAGADGASQTQETKPELKVDKTKADAGQRTTASKQTVEKKTEVRQPEQTQPSAPTVGTHDRSRNPDRGNQTVTPPQVPPVDTRNPPGPGHPPGTNQTPSVRTFPNGVRVVTQPDGTRIMIMPNGSTRVIPPAQRPNRRRPRP
jgi:hypothetical protein